MIYRATRHSRSDGFEWESGTPIAYQRCSDMLMGCRISDRPYYVICGHEALRVTVSEGEKVDSRENRLYTAEELKCEASRGGGLELLGALVSGASGQGTVLFPDVSAFEAALRYAARHLPRSRTGHIIISENAPAYGTTVQLVFRSGQQMQPPEWITYLPVFAEPASGTVHPAEDGTVPRWDDLYTALVKANSNNHSIRLLRFIAFACGAEAGSNDLTGYAELMQYFTPDEPLIRRFFSFVQPESFDIPAMLPLLYALEGDRADSLLAAYTRKYLGSDKIRQFLEETPAPYPADAVTVFAEAFDRGSSGYSIETADAAELYALYTYIMERGITAEELHGFFARSENAKSMEAIVRAADSLRSGDADLPHVSGLMPAVLYWYDELDMAQCEALYGSEQTAARMIAQVRMLVLPRRMQKLDFRDDFYEPKPRAARLRDVDHFPRIAAAGILAGVLLLGAGAAGGYLIGHRSGVQTVPPPAESTTSQTVSATSATVTAATTTTTAVPPVLTGLRTQQCLMDDAAQERAEGFFGITGIAPEGTKVAQGIVYYTVPEEALAAFSRDTLPAAGYLIPYRNAETAGILCLAQTAEGGLYLEQNIPADSEGNLPAAWFDLQEIERQLDARTAEPSDVQLLVCPESPYRRLVWFVSGGESYVIPEQYVPELAEGRSPLTAGSAYRLADYLAWLTPPEETAAETTAPAAAE